MIYQTTYGAIYKPLHKDGAVYTIFSRATTELLLLCILIREIDEEQI